MSDTAAPALTDRDRAIVAILLDVQFGGLGSLSALHRSIKPYLADALLTSGRQSQTVE